MVAIPSSQSCRRVEKRVLIFMRQNLLFSYAQVGMLPSPGEGKLIFLFYREPGSRLSMVGDLTSCLGL